MNHSPADILLQEIEDSNVLNSTGTGDPTWVGKVNRYVDEGDYLVIMNDTDGTFQVREMHGETVSSKGVRIVLRAPTFTAGYQKCTEIRDHFDTVSQASVTLDSSNYLIHAVHNQSNVVPLGSTDDSQREYFVFDVTLFVKETA